MDIAKVNNGEYLGFKTIEFECGGYSGAFTIDGANLFRLSYLPENISILNQPTAAHQLCNEHIFGIPLLFFPNRIKDGTFSFEKKTYNFPINGEDNTHIHGFLNGCTKWRVAKKDVSDDFINITFEYIIDENSEIYTYFDFKIKIMYENVITSGGLFQRISFENMSDKNMPFGFAYHTTFNVPFNASPENAFFVKLNLKSRYELDKCIPTGRLLPLDSFEENALRDKGCLICEKPMDNLYLADSSEPNAAIITDTATETQVVYESDSKFRHWILYNGNSKSGFLSVEPQTCCTNAVNSDIETANLMVIKPGEEMSLCTKLYVRK